MLSFGNADSLALGDKQGAGALMNVCSSQQHWQKESKHNKLLNQQCLQYFQQLQGQAGLDLGEA